MNAVEVAILIIVAALFIYALLKGINPYEAFAEGASEALPTIAKVLPYLAVMLIAINLFRRSGAMDAVTTLLAPLLSKLGIPAELATLIVLRPFSGSASLALLQDTLTVYGADGFIGRAASTIVGSTETIFYTLALYCGSVGIKRSRHALPVALLSGIIGTIASILLIKFI